MSALRRAQSDQGRGEGGLVKGLRTTDLARAAGVHPNTVRLYERLGFLPPVPRGSNGYRLFNEEHLFCLRLARTALGGDWPGR
ncbi:MAG: MerR family DNA-binding transcriptional regulator, partial [Patescibacteria group bacterium]